MSLSTHFIILGVLCLTISCKFSEQPLYSFKAFSKTSESDDYSSYLSQITLSADEDKIAVTIDNYRRPVSNRSQDIFNFNGEKVCTFNLLEHQFLFGWPSKTSVIYYESNYGSRYKNGSLWKANSPCSAPTHLADLPQYANFGKFTSTNNESFSAFYFSGNRIIQHNLGYGEGKEFKLKNDTDRIKDIDYSPNHNYLYAMIETTIE